MRNDEREERRASGPPFHRLAALQLGICFRREAPEPAVGPDRRAGKRGCGGKGERKRCFGESEGGGGGRWMSPCHRPWRRRKNSICSQRMTWRTGFRVPLQLGHWSGSPPQTCRMRSRQRRRMSRADCFAWPAPVLAPLHPDGVNRHERVPRRWLFVRTHEKVACAWMTHGPGDDWRSWMTDWRSHE